MAGGSSGMNNSSFGMGISPSLKAHNSKILEGLDSPGQVQVARRGAPGNGGLTASFGRVATSVTSLSGTADTHHGVCLSEPRKPQPSPFTRKPKSICEGVLSDLL